MISRRPVALGLAIASGLLAAVISTASAQAEPAKVESDQDKAIYLIGVDFSQRLQQLFLTQEEIEIIVRGLREGHAGKAMKLDPAVYGPKLALMQEERAKKALKLEEPKAAAYLEAERKKPGAKVLDSGLIYTEVSAGKGDNAVIGSKVKVHYTGTLRDGDVFDSSVERGTPAEFVLGQVIACWNEAIPRMKVGGKARLVCPADIAYGDTGVPGVIPPGAVLTFDVELLAVEK
jgi:FKBP-type peptidyl-prolyl cis-trans isomerase FkpA